MIKLFSSLIRLGMSIFPFIEIAFISYFLGFSFQSFPLTLIVFILLLCLIFIRGYLTLSIAWGILGFSMFYIDLTYSFFASVIAGIFFGGIRYLMVKGFKMLNS